MVNDHVWLCRCVQLCAIYRACYYVSVITDWFDIWINILIESSLLSSHIINVMIYCLTCLSFCKYCFDGFQPLSMCSRPYIFVFEITEILVSFSFSKISYRFHFRWKNVKVKMVESFTDCFRPFSSLTIILILLTSNLCKLSVQSFTYHHNKNV